LEIARQNQNGNELIKRKAISKNQQIPDSYLENILVLLKKGGIIKSARGLKGGYYLTKSIDKINLYEIIKVLEGKSKIEQCLENQEDCQYKNKCKIKLIWEEIERIEKEILTNISIYDLISQDSECIPCFREQIQKNIKG
jgi:Rrf2 family protein